MSTISSKQSKKQGLIDPMLFLVLLVLVLTFVMFAPFNTNPFNPALNAVDSFTMSSGVSGSPAVSFASDLQYWELNCSHGWSGDSTCEAIVARSQSCAISVDSAYCSEYTSYLKKLTK